MFPIHSYKHYFIYVPPPRSPPCQVVQPLSPTDVRKLSEGVRDDQKKLMEAAPTEWSSAARAIAAASDVRDEANKEEGAGAPGEERGSVNDGDNGVQGDVGCDGADVASSAATGAAVASSEDLLFRLLLAEMQGDGPTGGLNNRWIDRDALLQVRPAGSYKRREVAT